MKAISWKINYTFYYACQYIIKMTEQRTNRIKIIQLTELLNLSENSKNSY